MRGLRQGRALAVAMAIGLVVGAAPWGRGARADAPAASATPAASGSAAPTADPFSATIDARIAALAAAQDALFAFARDRLVTAQGAKRLTQAAADLRDSKRAMLALRDDYDRAPDAQKAQLAQAKGADVQSAADHAAAATALVADDSVIDHPAEARARARADADAAAQKARADADAARARAQQDAAQRAADAQAAAKARNDAAAAAMLAATEAARAKRAADDAARAQAGADAQARAAADAQAKRDAIAKAEADRKARADAAAAAVAASMAQVADQASAQQRDLASQIQQSRQIGRDATASLNGLVAQPTVSPRARAQAPAMLAELAALDKSLAASDARVAAAVGDKIPPRASLGTLAEVRRAVDRDGARVRALFVAAGALGGAVAVAQAPRGPSAPLTPTLGLVPICDVSFSADGDVKGVTVALDGGAATPLPAKLKVGGGRHALSVRRGAAVLDEPALVVCGHLDALVLAVPK